jgi:hypothetical protein
MLMGLKFYPTTIHLLRVRNIVQQRCLVTLPIHDIFLYYQANPPPKLALDYVYTGGPQQSANYGWQEALESDEYPLEIQCSPCFLNRFTLGYTSRFGALYK